MVERHKADMDDSEAWQAMLVRVEPLAHEMVERATRLMGPESVVTLDAQVMLAEILDEQGRHQAAADTCREILATATARLGECHFIRTKAASVLAGALVFLGEMREPGELRLQRIACARQRIDADNPSFLAMLSDTLPFMDRGGFAVEGEALARELQAALTTLGGGHGAMSFTPELYIARFASMQDRLDEAEQMFQSMLGREPDLEPGHRARLHLFYAGQLVRRGLFDEAEQRLHKVVELRGDVRNGTWTAHPDDVILQFIALYDAWGKPEKVEEYQRLRAEALASR
jgi:hypothetical protein